MNLLGKRFGIAGLPRIAFVLLAVMETRLAATEESATEPGASLAALARASEGKKFGQGECWDFAAALLDRTNCDWERPRHFGKAIDPAKEVLQPGDILQFESVQISWKRQNRSGTIFLGFPSHTAIVLAAKGTAVEIAHQNYNQVRHVTRLTLDLAEVTQGKWTAYRPVRDPSKP